MEELTLKLTTSEDPDYLALASLLDEDLYSRYGELQKSFDVYNRLKQIPNVIVLYEDMTPKACGAFKEFDSKTVEIKRIFVAADSRGKGFAKRIMDSLEELARNKGYSKAILETGLNQPEAVSLYRKSGYKVIQNFEPYIGNENSLCMGKDL